MRSVGRIAEVRAAVSDARTRGERIGFVPTMGFLHDGHLSLVDEARRRAGFVAMSIFVNPLQFAPTDDLARYPRDPQGDAAKAERRGVDLLFAPAVEEMYPHEMRSEVIPCALHRRWEGAVRPGHFAGVLTVVAKLFNIVQPDVAVFGQKDVQQATLVRAMVEDLAIPVEIVVAPTTREADGLAMSSRNSYLGADDRRRATILSRALFAIRDAYRHGERRAESLLSRARTVLDTEPGVSIDYVALADGATLEPVESADDATVAMIAARVGKTRLIDNVVLGA
ncbi:MAG TPA: pantoate--beta-alanine ligase [Gemmatimonadaceae bacterium]|nr:pantoate--beta-alanine ligase [Gemmatimonadaceae bacterium]